MSEGGAHSPRDNCGLAHAGGGGRPAAGGTAGHQSSAAMTSIACSIESSSEHLNSQKSNPRRSSVGNRAQARQYRGGRSCGRSRHPVIERRWRLQARRMRNSAPSPTKPLLGVAVVARGDESSPIRVANQSRGSNLFVL